MIRLVIGSILGGLAQFFVGFLFWGTPLSAIAFSQAGDGQNAAVQQALAQNLTPTGTGTYLVPAPSTQAGTTLFGQGPIATVHYNVSGFPVVDAPALIVGLVMSIIAALLIGLALYAIASRVTDFATRARVVILFAVAAVFYLDLGQPVFNHYGWRYFIYLALGDVLGLIAAGLVIARWFLPTAAMTPREGAF